MVPVTMAPGMYRHRSVMGTVAHMKEGSRERHWAQLVPRREQLYRVTEERGTSGMLAMCCI